jgi:hypothetical protein
MSGETDLDTLLRSMSARLVEGVYVFATVAAMPEGVRPRMMFQEAEGITLVLRDTEAAALGLAYAFPSRMITLDVHSSLEAVGFMARIASALADQGMGVNPVSAFFHDHLFVPADRADDAMRILAEFAT